MHVQNLGYSLPVKIHAQKPPVVSFFDDFAT